MAEFAAFEIADGLSDFFGSIHHKWAVTDYGFINRNAGKQQDFDFFATGFYAHFTAGLLKIDQFSGCRLFFAIKRHRSAQDNHRQIVIVGYCQLGFFISMKHNIPNIHFGERIRCAFYAVMFACNQT